MLNSEIMITDGEKYRSDLFKVIGIAFIAPFGRAVTDPYLFRDFNLIIVIAYILYTFVLLIYGIALLLEGHVILDSKCKTK